MKRFFYTLVAICIAFAAQAQLVEPIQWKGEVIGDSVRLTATIEDGWHLNIIELGDGFYIDEYSGTFTETVALADTVRVRFNACDDKMCTAPEYFEFVTIGDEAKEHPMMQASSGTPLRREGEKAEGGPSIWWIFLLGLGGGLLAIFTPCVWPIIPMTVSFFIKRSGAAKGTTNASVVRDAILYGLSIVIIYVRHWSYDGRHHRVGKRSNQANSSQAARR